MNGTAMKTHTHEMAQYEESHKVTGWVGWIAFASLMMMLTGVFQIIAGIIGLFKETWYTVSSNSLIVWHLYP